MRITKFIAIFCALIGFGSGYAQSKYTDAEGDALIQRLQQSDAKIVELEQKLRDCTRKCEEESLKANEVPLAVIYFAIGSSEISGLNKNIIKALVPVMKSSDNRFILTGWADDYTGSETVNNKLRKSRVENVKKLLVKAGIDEKQLKIVVGDGNLTGYGEKSASLDRVVTIRIEK